VERKLDETEVDGCEVIVTGHAAPTLFRILVWPFRSNFTFCPELKDDVARIRHVVNARTGKRRDPQFPLIWPVFADQPVAVQGLSDGEGYGSR
jgi:hypothetical protein